MGLAFGLFDLKQVLKFHLTFQTRIVPFSSYLHWTRFLDYCWVWLNLCCALHTQYPILFLCYDTPSAQASNEILRPAFE